MMQFVPAARLQNTREAARSERLMHPVLTYSSGGVRLQPMPPVPAIAPPAEPAQIKAAVGPFVAQPTPARSTIPSFSSQSGRPGLGRSVGVAGLRMLWETAANASEPMSAAAMPPPSQIPRQVLRPSPGLSQLNRPPNRFVQGSTTVGLTQTRLPGRLVGPLMTTATPVQVPISTPGQAFRTLVSTPVTPPRPQAAAVPLWAATLQPAPVPPVATAETTPRVGADAVPRETCQEAPSTEAVRREAPQKPASRLPPPPSPSLPAIPLATAPLLQACNWPVQAAAQASVDPLVEAEAEITWQMYPDAHPMVTASEKTYLNQCLESIRRLIKAEGGLLRYCEQRSLLPPPQLWPANGGEGEDCEGSEDEAELFRRAFEAMLHQRARTGGDTLFVQTGLLMSFGSKKLVKFQISCNEWDSDLSVCWDWNVKLENRCDS